MTDSEGSHDETSRVCLVTETGSHDGNSGNSINEVVSYRKRRLPMTKIEWFHQEIQGSLTQSE